MECDSAGTGGFRRKPSRPRRGSCCMTGLRFSPRHRGASRASRRLIAQGASAGASVLVDGRDRAFNGNGYFLAPTLIDHVTTDMSVYTARSLVRCSASFAPTASALKADNRWGNGGDLSRRWRCAGSGRRRGRHGWSTCQPCRSDITALADGTIPYSGTPAGPEGVRFFTREGGDGEPAFRRLPAGNAGCGQFGNRSTRSVLASWTMDRVR